MLARLDLRDGFDEGPGPESLVLGRMARYPFVSAMEMEYHFHFIHSLTSR